MTRVDSPYVCTECGAGAPELFKTYGSGILKLTDCRTCGKCVDKYVEYENTILCLDLLLLKKSAYRHFLFNAGNKNLWKLLLFLIIFEAFRQWLLTSNGGWRRENAAQLTTFTEPPWEFYFRILRVTLDVGVFVLFLISLSWYATRWRLVVDAFVLASFGELLTAVAALWEAGPGFAFMAIMFSLSCQAQAHSVVTGWPLGVSCFAVLLGFLLTYASPWQSST